MYQILVRVPNRQYSREQVEMVHNTALEIDGRMGEIHFHNDQSTIFGFVTEEMDDVLKFKPDFDESNVSTDNRAITFTAKVSKPRVKQIFPKSVEVEVVTGG